MAAVRADGLVKRFETTCAVDGVDLVVEPGETPVTYDVTVQSNGCWKAQSPPSFVGQQTMRDADGNQVVNPLFVIYGCLNPL